MALASGQPVPPKVLHPLSPQNPAGGAGRDRLSVTISARVEQRLREIAELEELTVSAVARLALSAYIKKYDREVAS